MLKKTLAILLLSTLGLGIGCGDSPAVVVDGSTVDAGASCLSAQDCMLKGEGLFCERPDGMCTALSGTCTSTEPTVSCPAGPTVCGCDGKTYSGDCSRVQSAVSKKHDGACP